MIQKDFRHNRRKSFFSYHRWNNKWNKKDFQSVKISKRGTPNYYLKPLSKSMCDVAFVAARLPLAVFIASELFTAFRAGKIVVGFSVYQRTLLPPVIMAGITAEQLLLAFRLLLNFRTAVLAIHILEFCVGSPANVLSSPQRPWRRRNYLTVSKFNLIRSATSP